MVKLKKLEMQLKKIIRKNKFSNKLKKAFHKKGLFFIKNHTNVLLLILFTLV